MFRTLFRSAFVRIKTLTLPVKTRTVCLHTAQVLIPLAACTLLTFAEGDEYVGEKQNGLQHGQGTMTYKDGSTYFGNWKAGKKHGDGSLFKPDGTVFKGYWDNYILDRGTIQFPNGDSYSGYISDWKPHGQGYMIHAKGPYLTYNGYFKEGKYFGNGVLRERYVIWNLWPRVYEGFFKDGKRHGFVVTRDEDNVVISRAIWENDKPVRKLE